MSRTLSRRELLVAGAVGGAALTLPLPDSLAAVRRKRRRDSVHCLAAPDRFNIRAVLPTCSFASFSPDGLRIALETPSGIEILDRKSGARAPVTPPGFTLAGNAWHPAGDILIASGPASDGTGPYLYAVTATGLARLLPAQPGQARAASFAPDGRKVAFTYLNRFAHQVCMADWDGRELRNPLNLMPIDPATDPDAGRVMGALAWHETRTFSPDGTRLYFAADRGAGMGNVSIHYLDLKSGKRNRVTYDDGFAEGAVIAPDDEVLYSGITRARDPSFMTMVSGPAVPPFLGFAATPTLHDSLARRQLTLIGNGDVLAVDPTYGLHGRIVGNRRVIAKKLKEPVSRGSYRVIACSMSPDGTELAVAAISAVGQHVVLLRRRPRSVPPPVKKRRTRTPPGSAPLSSQPLPDINRTIGSRNGGRVTLNLAGDLGAGNFQMALDNFSSDGLHVFAGTALFQTAADGAFRHVADVRRVGVESQEDTLSFYKADMRVAWEGETSGTIGSNSRAGSMDAAWDGTRFAGIDGWRIGDRGPRPVPGAEPCVKTSRR